MTMIFRTAGLMIATATVAVATPAFAQANSIMVVDLQKAAVESNAFRNAEVARQTTYKPQIDAANAAQTAARARLEPMAKKLQADAAQPNAQNNPAVQTEYTEFQRAQREEQAKINQILQPIELSQAYGNEQIGAQMDAALKAAQAARGASLVLDMRATVSHTAASDLTSDVTAQLNRLVPSVQIVPPPGWVPAEQRAAAGEAAPAATQTPAPATNTRSRPRSR